MPQPKTRPSAAALGLAFLVAAGAACADPATAPPGSVPNPPPAGTVSTDADAPVVPIAPQTIRADLNPQLDQAGITARGPYFIQPSLRTELTATSNANFGTGLKSEYDTIISVEPGLVVRARGADYLLDGNFLLDSIDYIKGAEPSRVLPRGTLDLHVQAAQDLAFIDLGVHSIESADNPYSVTPTALGVSTFNVVSTTQYIVSPSIDTQINDSLHLTVRSDNTWSTIHQVQSGSQTTTEPGYFGRQTFKLDDRPTPIGWSVWLMADDTDYSSEGDAALRSESARLIGNVAIQGDLVAGLIGGYEHTSVAGVSDENALYGVRVSWKPTRHTDLEASVEHRFFGTGWDVHFEQHTPLFAFSGLWVRNASTYLQSIFSFPTTANLTNLLDSALSSEFPDANTRARVVQDVLTQTGLPPDAASAANLLSEGATIIDSASGTLLFFVTPRDVLSLTGYRSKNDFLDLGEPIVGLSEALLNNVQTGATVNMSHRLTPLQTISVTLLAADTTGLGSGTSQHSRQKGVVLEYTRLFSPKTSGFFGVRRQVLDSSIVPSATESALFLGVNHRF